MNEYIYLIVAPSGTGKTAVTEYLENKYGLKTIPSYTTRQPRYDGEIGHIFVTKEEFDLLPNKVAYTYFDKQEYCATSEQVDTHEMYVIDPDGVEYFKENYHGYKTPIIIHLYASTVTRMQRMRGRGDSEAKIMSRAQNDLVKFMNLKYDIKIDTENKSISDVAEEVYGIINGENE